MKPEYLKKIFEPELERAVALLKETDPRSEDYGRLLFAISELSYRLKSPFGAYFADDVPEVNPAAPDPVAPPVTEESAPAPAPGPVVKTADDGDYINPEELRAYLAEAKKKGVNIAELIASLGAANFSGLRDDQSKLRQLKLLAEAAILTVAAGKV